MFEVIGEIVAEGFFHLIIRIPIFLFECVTGKSTINGYRTEYKRYIKFEVARKHILVWDVPPNELSVKLKNALEATKEQHDLNEFHLSIAKDVTIVHPPNSISFYSFHFLVKLLGQHYLKAVGVAETTRTVYTTYNDPKSANLIGKTEDGKRFFISLKENYSKKQFLRIDRNIETLDHFDIQNIILRNL